MNQAEGNSANIREDHFKAIFESNDVYLKLFQGEFETFKSFKHKKRSTLIKQNIELKNVLCKKINFSKNSTKLNFEINKINENLANADENIKDIRNAYNQNTQLNQLKLYSDCEREKQKLKPDYVINLENNFSIKIPKGIFYYPIERVIRADDIHVVNFIPFFSDFKKFEKVIEKTNLYLDDWFDDIPHNLEPDEKIFNPEFAIWILIKGLQVLKNQVEIFNQTFFVEVLTIFSSIIEKNSSTVFHIFQIFLKRIINNKKRKRIFNCQINTKNSFHNEHNNLYKSLNRNPSDLGFSNFEQDAKLNLDFENEETGCKGNLALNKFDFTEARKKNGNNNYHECNNMKRIVNEKNKYIKAADYFEDLLLKYVCAREDRVSPKVHLTKSTDIVRENPNFYFDENEKLNKQINNLKIDAEYKLNYEDIDNDDKPKKTFKKKQTSVLNIGKYKKFNNNNNKKNQNNFSCQRKQKKESKNTPNRRMEFFRGAYCQICFMYYCPYHFKRDYKFYDYEFNNITLHKRYLKRLIAEIKPRSGLEDLHLIMQEEKDEKEKSNAQDTNKNQQENPNVNKLNLSFNLDLNEDEIYNINENSNFNVINLNDNNDTEKTVKGKNQNRNLNDNFSANSPCNYPTPSKSLEASAPAKKGINNNNTSNFQLSSERERRITKMNNNNNNYYCDSESPKKTSSSLSNLSRAKQVIQAYKLNVNDYSPCQAHEGACTVENCLCLKNRSSCEKFCNCHGHCKNEYPGCFCVNGCNASCSCATNMRECDPDICKCCAFDRGFGKNKKKKNLDSNLNLNLFCVKDTHDDKNNSFDQNKNSFNENYNKNNNLFFDCGNCEIFLGKRKKTCVSQSLVADNYGLFAQEEIEKDEFICEYIGELLSREETDRRSVFNDQLGLNYFFKLNDEHDIDAYAIGNEMRFVNHSSFGYDNCYARTKYVRGVFRIGLFALRKISKGEELFFDYKINWNVPWMNKYKSTYS